MADVIVSDLPEIISSTVDDYFIINDANATTAIISYANLIGSITDLGTVGFADGTALQPSITFTSDPNVGIYKPSTDEWAVSTNGIQRLVIDPSGNIGINQPTPGDWFQGSNNLVVGDPVLGDNGITITSSTIDVGNISFADGTDPSGSRSGLIRYDHSDDHMRFDTASVEQMRITEDGYVGINVTAPEAPLHVRSTNPQVLVDSNDGSTESIVRWRKDTTNIGYITTASGNLEIQSESDLVFTIDGTTEGARLNSSGALLIGDTLPSSPKISLNANGSITAAGEITSGAEQSDASETGVEIRPDGRIFATGDTGAPILTVYTKGNSTPQVNIKSDGSITAAGDVKIGGTLPSAPNITLNASNGNITAVSATFSGTLTTNSLVTDGLESDGNVSINGNLNFIGAGTPGPELSTPAASTIALAPDGSVERIRVDASGAIGLSGANYGLDGQVLSSQGPGVAPAWVSVETGIFDISTLPVLP